MTAPISWFSHARDLAMTGTLRGPALFANLAAASMAGELALRGAEGFLSIVGYDPDKMSERIEHYTPGFVKTAAGFIGLDKAISSVRPFAVRKEVVEEDGENVVKVTKWGHRELALTAIATVVWSSLAIEAVELVCGKPHWGYNAVLQPISVFRLAETTPVKFVWAAAKQQGLVS